MFTGDTSWFLWKRFSPQGLTNQHRTQKRRSKKTNWKTLPIIQRKLKKLVVSKTDA